VKKHLDVGSVVVIAITFILFAMAVFFKGITHDLLLEAGVFLVSVKVIMMGFKNGEFAQRLENELEEIKDILKKR
jgi:hypothetical protein